MVTLETLYVHKWDFKYIDLKSYDEEKKENIFIKVPYIIKPKYEGKDIVISIFIDERLNERVKPVWDDGVLEEYEIRIRKADPQEYILAFDHDQEELIYFNYQVIFLMKSADDIDLLSELINEMLAIENDTVMEYSYKTNAKLIDLDDLEKDVFEQIDHLKLEIYATNLIFREIVLKMNDGDEDAAEEDWEEIKENVLKQLRKEEGNGTDGLFDF